MKYQLEILPRARRQLHALPERIRSEAAHLILELRFDPRPIVAEPLRDQYAGILKINVDCWRIFYTVDDATTTVRITNIKRRNPETYLGLYSLFF